MNISKNRTGFLLIGSFIVFTVFSSAVALIVDWWWLSEVGYAKMMIKSLGAKALLFVSAFVFSASFLLFNFYLALRSKAAGNVIFSSALFGDLTRIGGGAVKGLATIFSLGAAVLFGLIAAGSWQEILKYFSSASFGSTDPIFGKDIGFYIFSLPVYQLGLGLLKFLTLLAIVGSAAIYFFQGRFSIPNPLALKQFKIDGKARIHLGFLLLIIMIITLAGIYFSRFGLLTNQSGLVFGATYADLMVKMPMIWASFIVVLLGAVSVLFWMWKEKLAPLFGVLALYVVMGFAGPVAANLFQKIIVAPNELVKETPSIKNNIAATKEALGLNKIEEREISGDKAISADDIKANNLTIKNVRLWDRKPLLSTFSQIQEIRTYYEFAEVDNDRYVINGEIRQIMLSPRELASASLPNKNWINERLTFTHGYGVAAGPVNQVTPEGLPVLLVKDLPPKADVKELEITRPEIYFGELSNDYVITKTKSREFDYPKGEENVYTTYEGSGGVVLDSFIKRIAYAIKFQSLKLLLSNDITDESRILHYRNIKERVEKIAPFITFDKDPYAVIADGKIYWIADGYTISNNYPYSQPFKMNGESVNYVRNSVKAVVDAYNGSVAFYQSEANDAIIKTYANIFPGVFKPISEMPAVLASHLRYPEDIFTLQTAAYSIYHMDDPQIFYNKEDQWEIPAIASEGEGAIAGIVPAMQPRHTILKLPGEKKEEYVLMLPFTPRAKDNLASWMVARNDGESYGKLLVYRFPKDKLVFGPKQIIGRINQDPVVSQQISLWSQGGSQVIQGPLLVTPIEESLLYIRPLYLKAEAGKIPELKRVVVAYENKIAMEETLEAGLAKIFGKEKIEAPKANNAGKPAIPGEQQNKDYSEIFKNASKAYEEAMVAQKNGDWARYGEAIKLLGEMLK